MKTLICVGTSFVIVAALTACDSKKEEPTKPSAAPTTTTAAATAKPTAETKTAKAEDTAKKRTKGGGQDSAKAAGIGNQKLSATSKAKDKKDDAKKKDGKVDDVACEAANEGLAFCDSDTNLVFCMGGGWWELDCGKAVAGSLCGYDAETFEVDCWEAAGLVEDEEAEEAGDEDL